MASHFSDIGFPTFNQDEVEQLAMRAAESGFRYTTSLGDYIVWSPGEGGELWVHVSDQDEILQLLPHFAGTSWMMCSVTDVIRDPEYPLEGSIAGWACVTGHTASGAYPLTACIPDFIRHFHEVELPRIISLQVTAFAQEVSYFSDDESYYASQAPDRRSPRYHAMPLYFASSRRHPWLGRIDIFLRWYHAWKREKTTIDHHFTLAAESYIPIGGPNGFCTDSPVDAKPADESVLMSGHILSSRLCTCPPTGAQFFAMTLRVQEGTFDVVADANLFEETPPAPGGILQGTFWLSARPIGILATK